MAHGEDEHEAIIVSITDEGFFPKNLTVTLGETVTFSNDGANDHWPASDDHPTHEVYSEFDPQRPLIPNTSWSFTFDETGVFNMHDHLYPDLVGTITVIEGNDVNNFYKKIETFLTSAYQKIAQWWAPLQGSVPTTSEKPALNTAFIQPNPYNKTELLNSFTLDCDNNDFGCISNEIKSVTYTYGPAAATDILVHILAKNLTGESVDQHLLAHEIGRETARSFGVNPDAFLLCPTDLFNGGCQHGYFEYVLGRSDSTVEAAEIICNAVQNDYSNKFYFYCYHGIGHGLMMQQAYDLDASLAICDQFSDLAAQTGCWQGVTMENVNGFRSGYAQRENVFSLDDPLAPCSTLDPKYREQCYLNHPAYLMWIYENDIEDSAQACLGAGERWVESCMQGLGIVISNPAFQALQDSWSPTKNTEAITWSECQNFPEPYVKSCVQSTVYGIVAYELYDVSRVDNFCNLVGIEYQLSCWGAIGEGLRNDSTDPAQVEAACNQLSGIGPIFCKQTR